MVKNNQFEKNTIKACEKILAMLIKHGKIPKQWGDQYDYEDEYLDLPEEEIIKLAELNFEELSELDQWKLVLKVSQNLKPRKHTYRSFIKMFEDTITECKERIRNKEL